MWQLKPHPFLKYSLLQSGSRGKDAMPGLTAEVAGVVYRPIVLACGSVQLYAVPQSFGREIHVIPSDLCSFLIKVLRHSPELNFHIFRRKPRQIPRKTHRYCFECYHLVNGNHNHLT